MPIAVQPGGQSVRRGKARANGRSSTNKKRYTLTGGVSLHVEIA